MKKKHYFQCVIGYIFILCHFERQKSNRELTKHAISLFRIPTKVTCVCLNWGERINHRGFREKMQSGPALIWVSFLSRINLNGRNWSKPEHPLSCWPLSLSKVIEAPLPSELKHLHTRAIFCSEIDACEFTHGDNMLDAIWVMCSRLVV